MRRGPVLRAGSAWDGLSAIAARAAGCEGLVLSGASVAASRLALPDLGFVTIDDLVPATRAVSAAGLPVLVDIDNGFGNAATAVRAAHLLAEAGAAGVIVEDQVTPKRCGQLPKAVVDVDRATAVVRELHLHRPHTDFLIVARTDALAVNGMDDAIDRARRYVDAGADLRYVQGVSSYADLRVLAADLDAPGFHAASPADASVTREEWNEVAVSWLAFPAVAESAMVEAITTALRSVMSGDTSVDVRVDAKALVDAFDGEYWLSMGR